jgi:hypothetical protein
MELYSTLCKSTRTSFHSLQGLFATPMLSHLMVRFYEKPHSQEIACLFFQAFQKSNTQNSLSHVKEWMLALESPLLLFQAFQIAFGSDVAATATVGAAAASGGGSGSAMMMNQEVQEVQVSLESHHQKRKNAICYIVWFYCFFNPKSCVFFKEILDEMEIKLIKTSSPAFAIEWLQKNRCHFHQQFTLQRIRIIWSYLLSHLNQLCCTQLTEILSCIEYMLRRFIVPSIKEEQITKRSFQIGIMTQLLYDMEMFLLVKKKTNQKQFVQKKTHLNSLINWLKKVIQIMQSDDQIKLEIHHIQLVLKRFDYFKSLTNTK